MKKFESEKYLKQVKVSMNSWLLLPHHKDK